MNFVPFILMLLLTTFSGWAGCDSSPEEPHGPGITPRSIVNGTPSNPEDWKGVLGIWATTSGTVCTGTLVHPRVVLTAGHCVLKNSGSIRFDFQKNPGALRIYGGEDIRVWEGVEPIEYPRVSKAVAHPEWKGKVHSADLALLLLESPIDESSATPMAVALREAQVGDEAHLVGYGRIRPEDNTSDGHPYEASADIISISTRVGEGPYTVIKTGNTDAAACSGDSGGPLFTLEEDEWVVTGVASMSDCFADNLNVHLYNHLKWLDETLCDLAGQGLPGGACEGVEPQDSLSDSSQSTDSEALDSDTPESDSETEDTAQEVRGDSGCAAAPRNARASLLTGILALLLRP